MGDKHPNKSKYVVKASADFGVTKGAVYIDTESGLFAGEGLRVWLANMPIKLGRWVSGQHWSFQNSDYEATHSEDIQFTEQLASLSTAGSLILNVVFNSNERSLGLGSEPQVSTE